MTEKCRDLLVSGLEELALSYDDNKINSLLAFIKLIGKWNKAYNLTAIKNPADMIRLHLLDSLAILKYLQGQKILDIGTGAGLPGIPLAIFCPEKNFVLLDSNAKKTRFVQQAVLELQLDNVQVWNGRAEDYRSDEAFNSIISRAFSSIRDFIEVSERLLDKEGSLLAMKGRLPKQELEQISWNYEVYPVNVPGVDVERCLVKLNRWVTDE